MLQLTCYYLGEIVTPQWSVEGDATINANGLLTFNSEGEIIITATYNGVSESNTYEYVVYPTEVDGQYTIVGFIPVVSKPSITWGAISGKYGTLTEYNDAEEYVDHWGASGSAISRTITLNANTAQIKVTFYTNNLANSFIRNDTTGEYYYKGENVE